MWLASPLIRWSLGLISLDLPRLNCFRLLHLIFISNLVHFLVSAAV